MKHTLEPTVYYNNFGPYEPAITVADGDTIVTKTLCARGLDQRADQVAPRGNPLTGPIYVTGAEPGDTLVVRIDRAYPNRHYGWTRPSVAAHLVDADYVRELPARDDLCRWQLDLEAGTATLAEPRTALGNITLPLEPMLGCLGVAPSGHQAISTATSAQHGGNMDYRGTRAGATFMFPVFEPGALLFTGDGHATQGDGEIVGTGIEISFDVELTVQVIKGKPIRWPRGEDAEWIFTIGNARPMDQGVQHATTEMLRWLQDDYGLDPIGASTLLGQCVTYDVGNIFDPAYTMVCKVPKKVLALLQK